METKQATSDKTSDKSKRMIYAEDLLGSFRDKICIVGGNRGNGVTLSMIERILRNLIERAPTVNPAEVVRGQWIPVTERLPEHCVTVLSYDGRDYRTVKTDSYDHCFECWLSDMDDILDRNTVTHWMPLPEPPKEEPHG